MYILRESNNVINSVAGRSAITMKMNKKILNSSLVVLLALGLGGCAVSNSTTTSHKTHEASSSQVVKESHKKSGKSASTSAKNAATTNNHSTSAKFASSSSNSTSSAKNVTTTSSTAKATNNSQQVTAPAKATTSSSSVKEQKSVQLGLSDVATWTDSQGVTHNVDSDGMDRYTTKGSSQVQYKDWSGALPSGVTVSHNE